MILTWLGARKTMLKKQRAEIFTELMHCGILASYTTVLRKFSTLIGQMFSVTAINAVINALILMRYRFHGNSIHEADMPNERFRTFCVYFVMNMFFF